MKGRLAVSIAVAVVVAAVAFAALAPGGDSQREANDGWSNDGRRAFAAMGCGSCHRLAAAGSTGTIGPSLDERLAGHDRASLIDSIVRPPGRTASTMPDDYGERMTEAELDALVAFLLASR